MESSEDPPGGNDGDHEDHLDIDDFDEREVHNCRSLAIILHILILMNRAKEMK